MVNESLTNLHLPQRRSEPCATFVSARKSLSWSRARTIDVSAEPHRSRDIFSHGPLHSSGLSTRYAPAITRIKERKAHASLSSLRPVLFQQVRKYGCPVWQCRAEPVCEYLGRVINCIDEELEKVCPSAEHVQIESL